MSGWCDRAFPDGWVTKVVEELCFLIDIVLYFHQTLLLRIMEEIQARWTRLESR